jgi:hypothetical protein
VFCWFFFIWTVVCQKAVILGSKAGQLHDLKRKAGPKMTMMMMITAIHYMMFPVCLAQGLVLSVHQENKYHSHCTDRVGEA